MLHSRNNVQHTFICVYDLCIYKTYIDAYILHNIALIVSYICSVDLVINEDVHLLVFTGNSFQILIYKSQMKKKNFRSL